MVSFLEVIGQNSIKDDYRVYLSKDTVTINTYSDKILNIIADSTPIYKNAKLKVIFPKYFGDYAWDDMLWIIIPPNLRAGYLQAKSVSSGKKGVITSVNLCYDEFQTTPSSFFDYKFAHENNQRIVTVNMQDTLPLGDTLQIIYGANGSATYTYNSMIAQTDNFRVLLDNQNNGNYVALKDAPKIIFKQSVPKNLSVVLASTAKKQKVSLMKLMVSDIGKNITFDFSGTVQLTCDDPTATIPSIVTLTPTDSGAKDIPVIFNQNGIFTITAKVISSSTPIPGNFVSNPVNVSDDSMNIYWGELHTHGKISRDGFGDDGYLFAKNAVGLDFYGATDHSDFNATDTFGINREEWRQLKDAALRYHKPGRFVTFLAYENSLDNPSGHYNFIYNFDDALVDSVPMLAKNSLFTIQNFWAKLNQLGMQGKVLSIPHHTGKLFGTTGADNGASQFGGSFSNITYKRSIEIYSGHGLGEYYNPNHNLAYDKFGGRDTKYPCFAQDAWALKEKLGVIASTDSHNGTPSQTNVGYVAVLADSLTRNQVFNSIYNRHTYATTGERIILKFTINNAIMGDELAVSKDSFPTIRVQVNGTDILDYIELLKWDFRNGSYSSNPVHPIFQVLTREIPQNPSRNYSFAFIDTSLRDTSMYYIRLKQKNLVNNREVWAWSSPIWVNKPTTTSNAALHSDSLFNFNLQYSQQSVKVSWCMEDELTTDYFVVERHNTQYSSFIILDTIQTAHIAFKDSCYTYVDHYPDDSLMYYRVKSVSYVNRTAYGNADSIRIPFVMDSVYELNVQPLTDRIDINWKANEFLADKYVVERRNPNSGFVQLTTVPASLVGSVATYNAADFFPLKDSSFYRIWMDLRNGHHKISNLDTLFFISDSLAQFKAVLQGNNQVNTSWRVIHEQHTEKYVLQRSSNRNLFLSVVDVSSQGTVFDTTSYQYTDTSALPGWNYYRIMHHLANGEIKVSFLDSVKIMTTGVTDIVHSFPTTTDIKVLQNIVDADMSFIDYIATSEKNREGALLITGIDGKIYYQDRISFFKGNNMGKIPIGGLYSGSYYLLFVTEEGVIKDKFMITFHGGCTH